MRQHILLLVLIVCGLLNVGCCSINPERIKALKKEIADIGSDAQIGGPRNDKQKARVNAQVKKIWDHLDEISGIDSTQTTPVLKEPGVN